MSKLSQTMKMVSGSTTYQVAFYTTTTEAGAYGTYGTANVGGTTCYYGLGTGADKAHGSNVKTPLKVIKSSTTYYMLTNGNAELPTYTLKHTASNTNQTLTVSYKEMNITDTAVASTASSLASGSSVSIRKNSTWTATVTGNTGWNAGALSPGSSGTITANTTVSAGTATRKTYTLTKSTTNASTNQTLHVYYKNITTASGSTLDSSWTEIGSTNPVTLRYQAQWYATATGNTGWNAGAITKGHSSSSPGKISANTTVSIAAATRKSFTLTRSTTNASTNQTLHVYYKNYTSASGSTLDSSWTELTASVGSKSLYYQAQWYATATGNTGWNAGAITNGHSSSSPGKISANTTVSIAAATRKTYTLTKSATNASTNQTLKVYYKNYTSASGSTLASSWTELASGKSVTLYYQAQWYTTITASTGYTAGTVTNGHTSSSPGKISANTTVSVTAATINKYTLYVRTSGLKVGGTERAKDWSASYNYNTSIAIDHVNFWDIYSVKLYKGTSSSGTLWLTKTTKSFSFNMPNSNVAIYRDSYDDDCTNCDCDGDG